MAQALEEMPEVIRYVKNQHLGFTIPYVIEGRERQYIPDFIGAWTMGHGADDLLNLVVEVTGETKKEKAAKVDDGAGPVGAGGEQSRRVRAMGVCGGGGIRSMRQGMIRPGVSGAGRCATERTV